MASKREPKAISQKCIELRGDEAVLGHEMTRALAALAHRGRPRWIEKDHGFSRHGATLGGAERKNIDAGFPGCFRRAHAETRDRVCKPRSVHLHSHAAPMRNVGEASDLVGSIDGSRLG